MRHLVGILVQTGADVSVTELRETGANDRDFEAVKLIYIRTVISQAAVKVWTRPCELIVGVYGERSLVGQKIVLAASVVSSPTDCVFEWYPPGGAEVIFDEYFAIQIDSVGTGQANAIQYELYYDVIRSTEMELVKAIAGY
jgi:hypothetical protein